MAVGLYKCVVVLPCKTGLPADSDQNTFYFEGTNGAQSEATDIAELASKLIAFYNTQPSSASQDLASFLSDSVDRTAGAAQILVYADPGPTPPTIWGSPVGSATWTVDAGAAGFGPMPAEVACVLSYHADLTDVPETAPNPTPPPATIRPAARLRGRLYLGPFQINASMESGTTGDAIPHTELIETMVGAAGDLIVTNNVDLVWSGCSKASDAFWPVVGGFVDNAFDTQRRRGLSPSARTTW